MTQPGIFARIGELPAKMIDPNRPFCHEDTKAIKMLRIFRDYAQKMWPLRGRSQVLRDFADSAEPAT